MKRFKHSGAFGDLIYSLPTVKHFGGGEFYLHLNQIDWIGKHYYGSSPDPFHQGRMTEKDYDFMYDFMMEQDYIDKFDTLDVKYTEITHDLDRFRRLFVGHPTNYIDIYNATFNIYEDARQRVNTEPWLTVHRPHEFTNPTCVINRSARWSHPDSLAGWTALREQHEDAVFVGLPSEHTSFCEFTGWDVDYVETTTMLELAQIIAGAQAFAGNQSQCYALAVGLGVAKIDLETRRDMPLERNECYFPQRTHIKYF